MHMKNYRIFIVLLLVKLLLFQSCVSKKSIVYFQKGKIDQSKVTNDFVTVFKPDDLLQITISAENLESVVPFNLPVTNFMAIGGNAMGQLQQQLYLVDSKGYIDFPVLGRLHLGGRDREDVIEMFKKKLDPDYVRNPTVNIFITNFKINVTGDVRNPGTYTIPNERITVLEALALAGDLNISAQRNNIKVIREENGRKNIYNLNLLTEEIFTSPVY